jgi:hypothetical protein
VTSITENPNKFQNTMIWKEKSVEDVVTLGPRAHATLVFLKNGVSPILNYYLKDLTMVYSQFRRM